LVPVMVIAEAPSVSAAPPVLVRVTCCVAAVAPTCVPEKVRVVGDRLTAGAVPVPVSVTFCGDPVALSAIFSVAVRVPVAAGLKLTVIVQNPLAATLAPQVLVSEKAVALVPLRVIAEALSVSGAVPVLVSVTGSVAVVPSGVPGKVSVVGARLTAGAVPVPLSATCCGDPAALSAMLSVAVSEPAAAGLKLTVILQLAFAATLVPQALLSENEAALVPVMVIAVLASVSAAFPVLISVTVCVAVEPAVVAAKLKLAAERLAAAPSPVPLSETVCGAPAALSAMLTVAVSAPIAAGLNVTVMMQMPCTARLAVQVLLCE
jgi:hypothetical protein